MAMTEGTCRCGCGERTTLAPRTYTRRGWRKGEPVSYISGHNWRGKKRSPEQFAGFSETRSGPRNYKWKGHNAGYQSIHIWLRRWFPKTGVCEECGRDVGTHGPGGTHYANTSGEYHRDRADYRELCSSCHKLFDLHRGAA